MWRSLHTHCQQWTSAKAGDLGWPSSGGLRYKFELWTWRLQWLLHFIYFFICFYKSVKIKQLWLSLQKFKWGRSFLKPVTTTSSALALNVETDRFYIAGTTSTEAVISGRWCWKIPVGLCGQSSLGHTRAELCGKMEGLSLAEAVSFASKLIRLVDQLIVITAEQKKKEKKCFKSSLLDLTGTQLNRG